MERLYAPWRILYIQAPKKEEGCIFCRALENPEERYVIDYNDKAMVIMNIYPYNPGHMMIAPIRHTIDISSLTEEERKEIWKFVEKSIIVLKKVMNPEGFNIGMNLGLVAGAGVKDHMHIHIVPRWCGDYNFMPVLSDTKVLGESLDETYKKIKEVWKNGGP